MRYAYTVWVDSPCVAHGVNSPCVSVSHTCVLAPYISVSRVRSLRLAHCPSREVIETVCVEPKAYSSYETCVTIESILLTNDRWASTRRWLTASSHDKTGFNLRGVQIYLRRVHPARVRIWVISAFTAPNKHKSCKSCSSRTKPSVTATMIAAYD